ncbi:MAG: DUF2089 domain-containing protein [Bdellovibrionales bacterium]|nr:DUF2089 domain-containing protein [Bdellovibrionales bacterium]
MSQDGKLSSSRCSYCQGTLQMTELTCEDCALAIRGHFERPLLSRLSRDEQHFVELFIAASGSLKKMEELLGVSYPTVRNKLNSVIESLKNEQDKMQIRREQILTRIESGELSAKEGMRILDIV